MTDNILTDAEKLKKVVDMASQQNSKSYEATNSQEFKKAVEQSPKNSVVKLDERVAPESPTLMSKEQWESLVDLNKKSIARQVKHKKNESDIDSLKNELKELKEMMKIQMDIDKSIKRDQVYNVIDNKEQKVYSKVSKKLQNMDDDGFIDMTKEESPMNVYKKDDIMVLTPKDAGMLNPLPVSREKSLSPEIKLAINEKTVPNPIEKKIKAINNTTTMILFVVGTIVCLGLFFLGFSTLLKVNYFMSGLFSIVFTFGISLTIYLTKIKMPEHQIPRKETVHYNDFEMAEAKRCSLCNSKLQKSKVIQGADGYIQHIKCSNIACDFRKTIDVKKENGY